jgi:hypothetical protein
VNVKLLKLSAITSKIPNEVSSTAGRMALKTQKHSPHILFGAGVVGVVATVVLASRATLKLDEILAEADEKIKTIERVGLEKPEKYSEADQKQAVFAVRTGTAVDIAKLYGPAVIIGIASVCALTGSHVILNRRNAALTAAYKVLEKGFEEYRRRVVEEYGPDKDRELMFGVEERVVAVDDENGTATEVIKGYKGASIYAREFNEYSKEFSRAPGENRTFLQCQQRWANDLLQSRGHVFLNDVYDMLDIPRSREGAVVGWLKDGKGDGHIDFGIFDKSTGAVMDFLTGKENRVLLDFNVDGNIWDKI